MVEIWAKMSSAKVESNFQRKVHDSETIGLTSNEVLGEKFRSVFQVVLCYWESHA